MDFKRPSIYRPPSERNSYFLPITSGCSNSTCTFCSSFGSRLQIRDADDVKREIDAISIYMGTGTYLSNVPDLAYSVAQGWDGRRLFLQDCDALVYPFQKLKEILQYVNERLPHIERIGSYATPQDILRRTQDELRELRDLKLSILYVGVESGDDEVLERVGKGVDSRQIVEAGRRAKAAGITLSMMVILGLGGSEGSGKHAIATAGILTEIDPAYAGALTLTLKPGTPIHDQWKSGSYIPITPFRSLEELKMIIEQSSFSDCFFSSMHASNYLPIRGRLPQDKTKMLNVLEQVTGKNAPTFLRPEFLREL